MRMSSSVPARDAAPWHEQIASIAWPGTAASGTRQFDPEGRGTQAVRPFMVGQSRQVLARIAGNAIRARLAYLRARQRASNEEGPLVREADALLSFLRRSGCSFYPCSTLVRNAIPMGVAYRYDIHARDIPGGRLLAEFHRRHKIPATFFLLWDYSPFERSHFRYYRDLGNQ